MRVCSTVSLICNSSSCPGLRNEIDNLLSSVVSGKEDKNGEDRTFDQIRKLRVAMAAYQTDMKLIDRKLRKGEKEIIRSRRMGNNGGLEKNTHCIQNTSTNLELESNGFA